MEKPWNRIMCGIFLPLLLLAAVVLLQPTIVKAEGSDLNCISPEGDNIEDQDYASYGNRIFSYLLKIDGGYMRVQSNWNGDVMALYYDAAFNRIRRVEVPQELPIFGGFYAGEDNYYIVSGQSNSNEDDSVEVFRITKYDKNWNRLSSCGLYGANTIDPFSFGSCRIAVDGKYLLIRTCHQMYASDDGLNHQANVMIQVDTESMEIVDSYTRISNYTCGYVSHSFNQFIKIEDHKVAAVDHGDAYPRSICLMNYSGDVSAGSFKPSDVEMTNVMEFADAEINYNYTGASVGGFEISSGFYLIAGNSVEQNDIVDRSTRNIFVAAVDKNSKAVSIRWLTDYAEGETGCSTPHLIKTGTDRFMVLWSRNSRVYYTMVGADGSRQTQIWSMEGHLSDCVPLVDDQKVIWYTYDEGKEAFYQISLSDLADTSVMERRYGHDYELLSVQDGHIRVHCTKCDEITEGEAPTDFTVFWKKSGNSGPYWYPPEFILLVGDIAEFLIGNIYYNNNDGTKFEEFIGKTSDPENCVLDMEKGTVWFKESGIYKITVQAKYNPEIEQTTIFDVRKTLESVMLIADKTGTQPYGTIMNMTADADGGLTDELIYRFVQIDPNGSEKELENGEWFTYRWTANAIGTYRFRVEVTDPEDNARTVISNTLSVTIQKADLSGAQLTGLEDVVYTGNAIKPELTVKLNGKTLVKGTDYTLSYSNNVNVGTATVTVTGTGNYTGTATAAFEILEVPPESLKLTSDKTGTVADGATVKLTAVPEYCERTLRYKFMQIDPEGTKSQLAADDETDSIFYWSGDKAGTYRLWVEATDPRETGWSLTSNEIQITVEIVLEQPYIYGHGGTTQISEGLTARFYVRATGGELSYQWYYLKPGETEWKQVSAASGKTSEYSLVTEARHDGYQYYCKVSNSVGTVDSELFTLTVIPKPIYVYPPTILTQPKAKAVIAGNRAAFTVKAEGDGLEYQWYVSKDAGKTWSKVTAASGKTAKYILTTAAKHNGYRYRCVVRNDGGTVTSSAVKLTVITTPKITTQPPKTKTVKAGATMKLTVKATGEKLSYQWYVSKNAGKTWSKVTAASGKKATLSVKVTKKYSGYRYRCVVTNAAGKVTSRATKLTVK